MEKPHKGRISNWYQDDLGYTKEQWDMYPGSLGYIIRGIFLDHPTYKGITGYTSYIVSYNKETGEIETENSRYTLIGNEHIKKLPSRDLVWF